MNDSYVALRRIQENIGVLTPIESIPFKFSHNSVKIAKVQALADAYSGYRSVRGDGNCYYRAIFFSLIEQIISGCFDDSEKRNESFKILHDVFCPLKFEVKTESDFHKNLLKRLQEAANGSAWGSMNEFEFEIVHGESNMDEALVRACRKLTCTSLKKNQTVIVNEIQIKDAILPSYEARYISLKFFIFR